MDIQSIFNKYDKDGGGDLDINEFGKLLRLVAPALKDYEIEDVFKYFDINGDKKIQFSEFKEKLAYGLKGLDKTYDPQKEKAVKLISELCRIIKKYNLDPSQIFKNFDKSND